MRNNLLKELRELDGIIAGLQERRGDVIQMLATLTALESNVVPLTAEYQKAPR